MLSQQFLPRKAADSSIMGQCHCRALGLAKMQGLKSLTLRGRSFLGHSYQAIEGIIA